MLDAAEQFVVDMMYHYEKLGDHEAFAAGLSPAEVSYARNMLFFCYDWRREPIVELEADTKTFLAKALVPESAAFYFSSRWDIPAEEWDEARYLDTFDDWRYVFDFAEREVYPTVADQDISRYGFKIWDVAEVYGRSPGFNDGPDWLVYGKLKDGRYFHLHAGCDYTGWECQSGGYCYVSLDLDSLIQFAMNDEHRDRLGLG